MKRTMLILATSVFVTTLGVGIISPLVPLYSSSLGATGLWVGLVFGAFSLSRMVVMPLVGKHSDKKGRKNFLLAGLFFYSLASLGYIVVKDIPSLILVRIFHGLGSAMVLPIALAYAGDITDEGEEGRSMSSFSTAQFLGHGAGPVLGGVVAEIFGMQNAFFFMTFMSVVSFAFIFKFLPESVAHRSKEVSLRKLLKENKIRALISVRMFRSIGRGVIMAFIPLYAASKGLSTSQVGMLISSMLILTAFFQKPMGRLVDKHERANLITMGNVITTATFLALPFSSTFVEMLVLMFIMGIGDSLDISSTTALTASIGRKFGMGSTTSLATTAMSAALGVSPAIAGAIADSMGLKYVFYFGAMTTVIGSLAFNNFIRRR